MSVEVIDCEQNSPEWRAARLGIPTASRFVDILAKGEGKMRARYLRDLAAEIIRGYPEPETYSNAHMDRGHELEAEARALYALTYAPVSRVGFLRNGRAGASPDSLVGTAGGLEIKTALGHIQVDRLQRGTVPPEHFAQVQGNLWISEREWWDFMSYSPDMPELVVRVYRDEAYMAQLAKAVDAFNEELDAIVTSIRTFESFGTKARAA